MARRLLYVLLILQVLAHLFWLSPAVHSGQVAIPWMMNQGKTLFGDIWEQHAPGSSLLGAAAQSLLPIDPALLVKLLNTLLAVALTLLIAQLAKNLTGSVWAGTLAAAVFVWWEPVYGNVMLYFDTLLALSVLSALFVYFRNDERPSTRRILMVGLLMGLSTLFKQHAWLAVGALGLWLLLLAGRPSLLLYAGAALLLPLLQWLLLWRADLLDGYIFWNWTFNLSGAMDGVALDGDFFRKLLLSNLLVFPFALLAFRDRNRRHLLLVLLWLATLTVLYPRFGEIHAMGHLPFTAVMSGVLLAKLLPALAEHRAWDLPRAVLAGLLFAGGIGWLWTGAVSYIPNALGPGAILAYDEFQQLADGLRERAEADDTLFALPETDSTPQLHPLTGMLPPGIWIKGWRWYFKPDRVLETLKREWKEEAPPTWIVVFPDLTESGEPGISNLLDIVDERYQLAFEEEKIFGHGRAEVYRLSAGSA